jgi:catechol 2,3-dioxygenase-like lactoylglutathione lyase family enzyme
VTIGLTNTEMHFTELDNPMIPARAGQGARPSGPEDNRTWGTRDDTGEHYTYIRDPDGNLIELVYHPLGLVDADGHQVEIATHPGGIRWRQLPEVEAALGTGPAA